MKYKQVKAGDWEQPVRRGYKLCCCDCGLVHRVNFRIVKGKIQMQWWRANGATGHVRRHLK